MAPRDASQHGDVPRISVALSAYLEPTLWFDASALAHRSERGHWTGGWSGVTLPDPLPSRKEARRWLAAEPLGGAWLARLDDAPERTAPLDARLALLRAGPRQVLDVAEDVIAVLRARSLSCALIGSSAIFLQRPFRLSADVDVSLQARLAPTEADALAVALGAADVDVGIVKTTYLFGVHRPTGVTLDVEAGSAYRQPLADPVWARVHDVHGLPVVHLEDLLNLKAVSGRDKDRADARFLAGAADDTP